MRVCGEWIPQGTTGGEGGCACTAAEVQQWWATLGEGSLAERGPYDQNDVQGWGLVGADVEAGLRTKSQLAHPKNRSSEKSH